MILPAPPSFAVGAGIGAGSVLSRASRIVIAATLLLQAGIAGAHDGVRHKTPAAAAAHAAKAGAGAAPAGLPFPIEIAPKFELIDQSGRKVTERTYAGRPVVLFFGYASCKAICSVALPRLGAALDLLGARAGRIAALMITVDPARDTPESMGPALARWHRRLRGLTGTPEQLARARAAFQVDAKKMFDDPNAGAVYSHGSFIYLIGADGKVKTLIPPILGPERIAALIAKYL